MPPAARRRHGVWKDPDRRGGVTLIEALVSLAVMAAVLAVLARQIGASALAARRLEAHVALVAAGRVLVALLPRGGAPLPPERQGRIGDVTWQLRVSPFPTGSPAPVRSFFAPQRSEARLQAPDGSTLSLETVRLQRRAAP